MNNDQVCDGCAALEYSPPVNKYDYYAAQCFDEDKPVMGARRVVAVSSLGRPFGIIRPAWCRGKVKKYEQDESAPDSTDAGRR